MSTNASIVKRAWSWSCRWSPLLHLFGMLVHRGYPNRSAERVVREADLPAPVGAWILLCVRRTRLWRWERAEVARELVSHCEDAIGSGSTVDELVGQLGDARTAARLVRRSVKRKRPWVWKRYKEAQTVLLATLLIVLAGYGYLAVRFFTGEPSVTTNYIAMLNERREQYEVSEHAWPVYQEIWRNCEQRRAQMYTRQKERVEAYKRAMMAEHGEEYVFRDEHDERLLIGIKDPDSISNEHPDYGEVVEFYRSMRPLFDRVIEASDRPCVGILYSDRHEEVEYAPGLTDIVPLPPNGDPQAQESTQSVLLLHLGMMRGFTYLLLYDARLAAAEGDGERAARACTAILRMVRQLQDEPRFLISDLVALSMVAMWEERVTETIREHPELLSTEALATMTHELAVVSSRLPYDTGVERLFFEDTVQRVYTDDGSGNGRLTPDGVAFLEEISSGYHDVFDSRPIRAAASPLTLAVMPDRATSLARFRLIVDELERVMDEGPESIQLLVRRERELAEFESELVLPDPVVLLTPAYGFAATKNFQAQAEAGGALVMLALEVYRRRSGGYPDSLDQIPVSILPRVPEDLMDPGEPIKYKMIDAGTNGGYVLYSVGSDGDDDNARAPEDREQEWLTSRFTDRFSEVPYRASLGGRPLVVPIDPRDQNIPPDCDWILVSMERTEAN